MSDGHECPNGCGSYQRLSRHWSSGACDFPPLDEIQRETVEGLLLAGATIAGNGPNKHLTIGTTSDALATWTEGQLDWLHHGTRTVEKEGNRQPINRVRTHAHATLSRYHDWFDDGCRSPPEGLEIPTHTARTWYAYAGGIQWHGEYASSRTAIFSALHDDRAEWIVGVLESAGYNSTRAGKRVQLPPTETDRWLEWIGGPVPGVEHKWAKTRNRYDDLRR